METYPSSPVQFFEGYNWNALVNGIDNGTLSVDQAFADFVTVLQYALEYNIVGYRTVTVRLRDPPYITPPIKVLLRKRSKLLRRGKTDSAQLITIKIGKTRWLYCVECPQYSTRRRSASNIHRSSMLRKNR